MSGMIGMDVEAIRNIARQLDSQAQQLESVEQQINAAVEQTQSNWRGQDAQQFKQKWDGEYRSRLRALRTEIQQLSMTAVKNANEQQDIASRL